MLKYTYNMEIFKRFTKEKKIDPILMVEEQYPSTIGPFSQVEGIIMRDEKLPHNRYGDAIWQNKKAICVIDASSPFAEHQYLNEVDMANDLQNGLSDIFDDTPLTPSKLINALDMVLTSNGRNSWKGKVEFGISVSGIYSDTDQSITFFNIGTGAIYINNKIAIVKQKEFYNPYPMPGSKKMKNILPTIFTLPQKEVASIIICTDGIDFKRYLPTSDRPITEFIAPDAEEATILRFER